MIKNIPDGFKKILYWFSVLLFMILELAGPVMILVIMRKIFHIYLYGEEDTLAALPVISITTLAIVFALNKYEHINFLHFPKLRIQPLIVSIIFGALMWIFSHFYNAILFPELHNETIRSIYGLVYYILSPFLAAITEEMFFRGWLLGYMEKKSFSKITIILTISTGFFLFHWLPFNPIYLRIDTFILSVLTCCMFFKTRDLRYSILIHLTADSITSMTLIIPYLLR